MTKLMMNDSREVFLISLFQHQASPLPFDKLDFVPRHDIEAHVYRRSRSVEC